MNHAPLTDAELAELERRLAAVLPGDFIERPEFDAYRLAAVVNFPRLVAEVKRLREVETRMRQYTEGTYRPETQG